MQITGLHHVTAMASDAQKNVDFYAGILGLRMVKKTINFDAPDVYHLYYGDETGAPETIMTFFPFPGISPRRKGRGQMNALDYWMARLDRFRIPFKDPQRDPHVPLIRSEASARLLTGMGARVMHQVYPGKPHIITEQEIKDVQDFIFS